MYHVVRNPEETRFPHVKALRIEEFRGQVEYLERHYTFITVDQFLGAIRDPEVAEDLPDDPVLLTFDDGYLDHYENVFPVLHEKKIEGMFFVPAGPIWHGRMLTPNAIQVVLSTCRDHTVLVAAIDQAVAENQSLDGVEALAAYHKRWLKADAYNTAEAGYVKRMLQTGLPEDLREPLVAKLLQEWVTTDERALTEEYYCSADNLREMIAGGMYIGPHSVHHHWMNHLPRDRMESETRQSLDFMRELGAPDKDWVACYPYGGISDELVDVCVEHGAHCGFTVAGGVADLREHDKMWLPRVDTDDLPKSCD